MKKTLLALLTCASLGMLASCNANPSTNNGLNQGGNSEGQNLDFDDAYTLSAISSINLFDGASTLRRARRPLTAEEQDKVIKNFQMVENLLTNEIVKSEETPSDKEEYQTMYTVTINDETTNTVYTYYYNEFVIPTDDYDEEEMYLEGIVIHDDVTYSIRGKKEIERDEMEMSFVISLDQGTYVEVEQEKEDGENGLEYTLYERGRKVYETEVEYEYTRHGIEYEFEEEGINGKKEYKFFVSDRENKIVTAVIKENHEEIRARFQITVDELGNKTYLFLD